MDKKRLQNNSRTMKDLIKYSNKIFRICLGFTKNPLDAEELMQEVYLRALRKIDSLRNDAQAKGWLFRIARNTCMNFVKKQQFFRLIRLKIQNNSTNPDTPELQLLQTERFRYFKGIVHSLPKKQREVFVLKEYGDLSYREIAQVLGIREGTVMSRLNRARQAILNKLEEDKHA